MDIRTAFAWVMFFATVSAVGTGAFISAAGDYPFAKTSQILVFGSHGQAASADVPLASPEGAAQSLGNYPLPECLLGIMVSVIPAGLLYISLRRKMALASL